MRECAIRSLILLTAALLLAGCASGSSGGSATGGGTAVVEFVNPENYTDLQLANQTPQQSRDILLPDLEKYIHRQAARYLPEGDTLTLRILDIDQAGQIRYGQGGQARVGSRNSTARISFEYKLTDASGNVLKSGSEALSKMPSTFDTYNTTDTQLSLIKTQLGTWISRLTKS